MYRPHIPWGTSNGTNYHQYPNSFTPVPGDSSNMSATRRPLGKDDEEKPPPIPQRQNSYASPYQSFPSTSYGGSIIGNPYQSYMYGANTGGMYGYSNFGGTSNMLGYGANDSMFGGLENASQTAFQSAQAFIGAFSSVSMMLESTLFAVQNSVRAIASVADQFGHLRSQIIHTSSSFFRVIRYYLRKILILFKLRKPEKDEEKYWLDAMSGVTSSPAYSKRYASLLFFCVLIATPWFVWKLLRAMTSEQAADNSWFQGSSNHFVAEVKFPFTARNNDELSISPNTIIRLAPKSRQLNIRGWLLASDGETQGLVPANYIKILGKNRKDETPNTKSEKDSPGYLANETNTLETVFEDEERKDQVDEIVDKEQNC